MNLAAIDIGTNSFHLIIVELKSNGFFDIIDRDKEVIRLGEGNPGDIKIIQSESIERAVETLKRFKGIADSRNAEIHAVATSAVREARNSDEFTSRIINETGIEIEVISGIEEARLIHLGISNAVDIFNNKTLSIDIGGGSTEFILSEKGRVIYANSLKLGAVRFTNKFFPNGIVKSSSIFECNKWIEGVIFPVVREITQIGFDKVVGSSGTITSAASMIAGLDNSSEIPVSFNNACFSEANLKLILEKVLKAKSVNERKKIAGLDAKRADIIPAGLLILSKIFEKFEIHEMTVSGYALREGIIYNLIQQRREDSSSKEKMSIRSESVTKLSASCNFPREHCEHVAELAKQIYLQLNDLHKLPKSAFDYLIAAARLHDIGYHIAHSQHHRHGQYIIRNSELLGFNDTEIQIIANIARYHRKSHPKKSHEQFMSLSEKNKEIVKKLAAILRIADSLDRSHLETVEGVKVNINANSVELELFGKNENPEIELWSFDRRKGLFEETYGIPILVKS